MSDDLDKILARARFASGHTAPPVVGGGSRRGHVTDAKSDLDRARVRKEAALANRYEVDNAKKRGELVEVAKVRDAFAIASSSLRLGIDGLRQAFGDRAAAIMEDALKAAEAAVDGATGGGG